MSSSGMTDKTMEKLYNAAAFVKPIFSLHLNRDYGLNAGHFMKNEKYVYFVCVKE